MHTPQRIDGSADGVNGGADPRHGGLRQPSLLQHHQERNRPESDKIKLAVEPADLHRAPAEWRAHLIDRHGPNQPAVAKYDEHDGQVAEDKGRQFARLADGLHHDLQRGQDALALLHLHGSTGYEKAVKRLYLIFK